MRPSDAVTRLLGPEGARRGADAVLAEDFEDARTVTVRVRNFSSTSSAPPDVTLEGLALRYVGPSCG